MGQGSIDGGAQTLSRRARVAFTLISFLADTRSKSSAPLAILTMEVIVPGRIRPSCAHSRTHDDLSLRPIRESSLDERPFLFRSSASPLAGQRHFTRFRRNLVEARISA